MPATSQLTEIMTETLRMRLMERIAEYLPDKVSLGYVSQGDQLMTEQIVNALAGGNPWEDANLDEFEANSRWEAQRYYIDDVQHALDISDWAMDLVREDVEMLLDERNDSDVFGDLVSGTPAKWMRYWFDERDLDTDYLMDRVSIGVHGVGQVLDALGLLGTDQQTPELENQIADILANSGTAVAIYLLWHDDLDSMIEAAANDYEGGPTQMITWENPYLLLYNPFMGHGYADEITATITMKFDRTLLRLDERGGGGGYSYTDEVAGWGGPLRNTTTVIVTTT